MTTSIRKFLIFCHFALPIVFITAAATLHGYPKFLTWQVVVVLAIACLPFILPLLAYYVKGIGKDGVMMNNIFDGSVPAPVAPEAGEEKETTPNQKALADYSKPAKKVLRTLWKFQHEHFQEELSRRWAFGIHPSAMDFPQFYAAYRELNFDGLISMGPSGMVFLTDKGVDFCTLNNGELTKPGDIWDRFEPA